METSIPIVTDRPALRESPRRDRRRGKGAGFSLAQAGRGDAPAETARDHEDTRATARAPAEDETGTRLDVLG